MFYYQHETVKPACQGHVTRLKAPFKIYVVFIPFFLFCVFRTECTVTPVILTYVHFSKLTVNDLALNKYGEEF